MSFQSCMTFFLLKNTKENILKNVGIPKQNLVPIDFHYVKIKPFLKIYFLFNRRKSDLHRHMCE